MDLVQLTPESRTIISDALHNYGTSWTSDEYEAGTDFTLATIEHHESGVVDTGYVASMDNSPVDSLYSTHCSGYEKDKPMIAATPSKTPAFFGGLACAVSIEPSFVLSVAVSVSGVGSENGNYSTRTARCSFAER